MFLWGLLAEACIALTALDLLRLGFEVYLVKDGITSLTEIEKEAALKV